MIVVKTIVIAVFVLIALAVVIGVFAMALIIHDYESEKEKCGNCACRDEQMRYCWSRGFHVGTETKACSLFQNKNKI